MTSLQRNIEEILTTSQEPVSVPSLVRLLGEGGHAPHKTSVYRNLERMVAHGSVEEVFLDAGTVYYEYKQSHHHHAQCSVCRAVVCIANDLLEKSIKHLERAVQKNGFMPTDHHVVLRGVCASCQG